MSPLERPSSGVLLTSLEAMSIAVMMRGAAVESLRAHKPMARPPGTHLSAALLEVNPDLGMLRQRQDNRELGRSAAAGTLALYRDPSRDVAGRTT